jgi:hypothetical protein
MYRHGPAWVGRMRLDAKWQRAQAGFPVPGASKGDSTCSTSRSWAPIASELNLERRISKDDIFDVVAALNSRSQRPLDEIRLKETFEKWWLDLAADFKKIEFRNPHDKAVKQTDGERLEKIENALESILPLVRRTFETQELQRFIARNSIDIPADAALEWAVRARTRLGNVTGILNATDGADS